MEGFPYQVLVHWNEFARGFVARIPALPGCIALAGEAAAAISRAQELAQELLARMREAGESLPPPDAVR